MQAELASGFSVADLRGSLLHIITLSVPFENAEWHVWVYGYVMFVWLHCSCVWLLWWKKHWPYTLFGLFVFLCVCADMSLLWVWSQPFGLHLCVHVWAHVCISLCLCVFGELVGSVYSSASAVSASVSLPPSACLSVLCWTSVSPQGDTQHWT